MPRLWSCIEQTQKGGFCINTEEAHGDKHYQEEKKGGGNGHQDTVQEEDVDPGPVCDFFF